MTANLLSPNSLPKPDSLAMLQLLTAHCGAFVAVLDTDLVIHYANEAFAEWYQLTAHTIVGRSLQSLYGEAEFQSAKLNFERCLSGEPLHYERYLKLSNRRSAWLTVTLNPIQNVLGQVQGLVLASHDVHQLKTTSEALQLANQKLLGHMHNSPLAVIEFDQHFALSNWSERACGTFGYSQDDLQNAPLAVLLGAHDHPEHHLRQALNLLLTSPAKNCHVTCKHVHKDGRPLHCEWFISALHDEWGAVVSVQCLVEEVTNRIKYMEHMKYTAEHDALTNLPNRVQLQRRITELLEQQQSLTSFSEKFSLLYLDLDGFKEINDQFGHAAGDSVLIEVALRLSSVLGPKDMLARIGGDEFVILSQTDHMTTYSMAQHILLALQPLIVFELNSNKDEAIEVSARVGVSIGIAEQSATDSNAQQLIRRADAAMYAAKRAGKGQIKVAEISSKKTAE